MQQKYYTRKAREIFAATLSVVSPGQEEALWESLRREPMLENEGTVAKNGSILMSSQTCLIP